MKLFSLILWRTSLVQSLATTQNMKFSIKDLFSKYEQIHRKLWIWSHLLKKSLIENFIFCAVLWCFILFSRSYKCYVASHLAMYNLYFHPWISLHIPIILWRKNFLQRFIGFLTMFYELIKLQSFE